MKLSFLEIAEKNRILDDMKTYYPNFKRKHYETCSLEELRDLYQNYINSHLPFNSDSWLLVNEPDEGLIYKDGPKQQVQFVKNKIYRNLFFDKECVGLERCSDEYDDVYDRFLPMVVSMHKSKSVLLPVFELNLKSVGVKIVLRNNFYDWNVSVESEKEIVCDFKNLLTEEKCYCEGFPNNKKYGKYEDNCKCFTVCIPDDYKLFTFMWLLREYFYQN